VRMLNSRTLFIYLSIMTILVLGLFPTQDIFAQDAQPNILNSGEAVVSTLDADNLARVFLFAATAGDTLSVQASSENGMALALVITDETGVSTAQSIDSSATGSVTLENVVVADAGNYYLIVFAAPGVFSPKEGTFEVAVTTTSGSSVILDAAEATPAVVEPTVAAATAQPDVVAEDSQPTAAPVVADTTTTDTTSEESLVLISGGMEVTLNWNAAVDMNLEVRDPNGESLFWNNRTSSIGGSFGFDANGLCEVIDTEPAETASWTSGFVPTGSYEILVFYRQGCDTNAPVSFTVNGTVNGVALDPITGTLPPPQPNQDSVYVSRFELDADGNAFSVSGGVYTDASLSILPALPAEIQANAQPIQLDSPVQGLIDSRQPYLAYTYTGNQGDVISATMTALSGSLDTLVQVMDEAGNVIYFNDDFNGTDSSIPSARLIQTGTYYIVATRYGKEFGGTQGEFNLVLSGPSADVPPEIVNLNLPVGDIQVILTWNTNADLQLLVRDPAGEGVFDDNPIAISGGTLLENGNVNCTVDETQPPLSYIYWPVGTLRPGTYELDVWYQADCSDIRPIEFTLTAIVNGEVAIVETQRPVLGQNFVISLEILPDGSVTAGLGGYAGGSETVSYRPEIESAIQIPAGQEVFGNISGQNTFDVYVFDGLAGDIVTINMSAVASTLDTKVFLVSPSGIELADNDDAIVSGPNRTTNSEITQLLLPEDGQYVIVATRYATLFGGTVGGYSLLLRQN